MPPNDSTLQMETDPFYVEDLRQMERAVNYRRWQLGMVDPFLSGKVLEVGGGIGNFTVDLAVPGRNVTSIEPNGYCFHLLAEKCGGLDNIRPLQGTVEALDDVLEPGELFDSVVMMNVLEHIRDDHAALASLAARMTPEGRMAVLVPAGQWAFGPVDERLGHFRRYDKEDARLAFAAAGMKVDFMRYYNCVGIFGWWWNARFGKRISQSDAQIRMFDRHVVPIISRMEKHIAPPLGQSLLAVGRRIS
jgi:SAM-dependent methyltransferase